MLLESRAPVRIDFAGAWTDVKFFAHPFGGATLNGAINHFVTGRVVTGSHPSPDGTVAPEGISVTYETDIPNGSGLGTSSALNVVWLSLARGAGPTSDEERARIAEQAYEVETVLGILGGKQDQYAAAFGGFHLFEFSETGVNVQRVDVRDEAARELNGLLTLCYTGQARLSSNLHENVWGGFRAGKRSVVDALFRLRDSAYEGREILESANWDALGPLLQRQHECARALDESTSNQLVEGLFDLVRPHIVGGKCCGAGGGGCMMFLSPSPQEQQRAEEKLRAHGVRVIPFEWAHEGLSVSHT